MTINERQKLFEIYKDLQIEYLISQQSGNDFKQVIATEKIYLMFKILKALKLDKDFEKNYHKLGDNSNA